MVVLKNVLVATDFGEASELALAYGRELARTFGARLHVLHVVENVMMRYSAEVPFTVLPELQTDLETEARRRLDETVTADDRASFEVVPTVQTAASVPVEIVEYARGQNIDLIVMGTHGRGGVQHLLMGSVAERVVRTAPCPVLTVRTPERDFLAPDALVSTEHA
jgi:nucleotide-binding universal stress UspA family protein